MSDRIARNMASVDGIDPDAWGVETRLRYKNMATAALAAMREPTERMLRPYSGLYKTRLSHDRVAER